MSDTRAVPASYAMTPPKIEAGKFYRTRDGKKAGPMQFLTPTHEDFPAWDWRWKATVREAGGIRPRRLIWTGLGQRHKFGRMPDPSDLVAEWPGETRNGSAEGTSWPTISQN